LIGPDLHAGVRLGALQRIGPNLLENRVPETVGDHIVKQLGSHLD
jgi:hypothetical protein